MLSGILSYHFFGWKKSEERSEKIHLSPGGAFGKVLTQERREYLVREKFS